MPVDLLRRSGLGGLVARALESTHDPRAALFGGLLRTTLAQQILRLHHLHPLRQAAESHRWRWSLIKGAATGVRFPAMRPLRYMTDLDVLVHPDDFIDFVTWMKAAGWSRVDGLGPAATRWSCEWTFHQRGQVLVELDVHRALHQPPLDPGLGRAVVLSSERVDAWPVPNPSAALLVIAMHRARSGFRNAVTEVLDARLYLDTLDDLGWAALTLRAAQLGLAPALAIVVRMTHLWLGGGRWRESVWLDTFTEPVARRIDRVAREGGGVIPDGSRWIPFLKLYGGLMYTGHSPAAVAHAAAMHAWVQGSDAVAAAVKTERS